MLDIELAILFPMIDRLLGGAGEDEPPSRALTEIELALAARIVRVFLQCLESELERKRGKGEGEGESEDGQERQADKATRKQGDCAANRGGGVSLSPRLCLPLSPLSSPVSPLSLDLVEVVSNPRLLRSLPTDERVLVVGFRLDIGDKNTGPGPVSSQRRGPFREIGPVLVFRQRDRAALHPLPGRRAGSRRRGRERRDGRREKGDRPNFCAARSGPFREIGPVPFSELSVSWATTEITAEQLAGLRPGDIIATETAADGPVVVSLRGEPKFLAKPLAWAAIARCESQGPASRDSFSVGEHIDVLIRITEFAGPLPGNAGRPGSWDMSWSTGDFIGDGTVDVNDLTILLSNFGETAGSSAAGMAAVAEPSTIALLLAGAACLLGYAWRRRA